MKKYWGLLAVLFLSWWAIAPLFHFGFFPMHDNTQVVRVQQMAQALKDGQFPVRWVADLGYGFGYPIFNFYAPLAYYVGAFFNLIGFDVLLATKLMMVLGVLLSGVFMYLLAREFWGEIGGILSGLFYIYAPYHAVDIYVRGAVGEFWAMAFLPLVFYGFYKLTQEKRWQWVAVSGIGYAAVILSHNLTAVILTPILVLYILFVTAVKAWFRARERENKRVKIPALLLFYSFTLGLCLSAFYWLPALFEMNLTKVFGQIGGGADFRDHFIFLDQLWASPWGFGGSAPGRLDGMSFMIGKLHIIMMIVTLPSLLIYDRLLNKKETRLFWALFASLCVFAVAVLLTNQLSQPIWEAIPPMVFIQYPWRFLVFATFAASFMAGSVMLWLRKNSKLTFFGGAIIILALLFFNTKYFRPQTYFNVSVGDYINEENIKWKTSKISDEYLPKDFPIPQIKNEVAWGKVAVLEGEAEIKDIILKSHQYTFDVIAKTDTEILINTAYFPGWKVWVDGKEKDFALDNGKMRLSLQAGEHRVLARLTNTPIRTASNLISLISWIALIGFMLK